MVKSVCIYGSYRKIKTWVPLFGPFCSLLTVNFTVKFQRKHIAGAPNERGGKNFQPISRHISETVQDMTKVTMTD